MGRRRRAGRFAATWCAALALVAVGFTPAVAAEPPPIRCTDFGTPSSGARVEIRSQRIDGDLLADVPCQMFHSVVTGDVLVVGGGEIHADSSAIKGDVHVGGSGNSHLTNSSVYGGVHLASTEAFFGSQDSTIRRSVRGTTRGLALTRTDLEGAVNVHAQGVLIGSSTIGGWVNLQVARTFLEGSRLTRGLTTKSLGHFAMCGTSIDGDVSLLRTISSLTVSEWCGTNEILGDLLIEDSREWIGFDVTTMPIGGDLTCTGNSHFSGSGALPHLQVSGTRYGQCA